MLWGIEVFNQVKLKTLNEKELIITIKSFTDEVSDNTIQIVSKMLSKNPEDRPTIEELWTLFEE